MKSIRRQLLWWLLVGLGVAVVIAGAGTYYQAREEANELFDYQLRQMAFSVPDDRVVAFSQSRDSDIEEDFIVQVWNADGLLAYESPPATHMPRQLVMGFVDVTTTDGSWRVFGVKVHGKHIQVAQPLGVREELAASMALRTVAPLLVLLPCLGLLIVLTVRRGLRPLVEVTSAVQARTPAALPPLTESGLPEEVRPLVHALNDLLARLEHAMAIQKAFIADAAHEMRTPLTAIQLQLDEARSAQDPEEREAAFDDLQRGLTRTIHLVGQLLTLARQEPEAAERPLQAVDLSEIARLVVADQAVLASAKQVDLGIGETVPALVQGDADALRVMLGNLVDNAVRYTPSGGRADVAVTRINQQVVLSVQDSGPGIPVEDRLRMFDRFSRGLAPGLLGSGLGLAIVKTVADRHCATVRLDSGPHQCGLRVTVSFSS